jgi:hypothetical protein
MSGLSHAPAATPEACRAAVGTNGVLDHGFFVGFGFGFGVGFGVTLGLGDGLADGDALGATVPVIVSGTATRGAMPTPPEPIQTTDGGAETPPGSR